MRKSNRGCHVEGSTLTDAMSGPRWQFHDGRIIVLFFHCDRFPAMIVVFSVAFARYRCGIKIRGSICETPGLGTKLSAVHSATKKTAGMHVAGPTLVGFADPFLRRPVWGRSLSACHSVTTKKTAVYKKSCRKPFL